MCLADVFETKLAAPLPPSSMTAVPGSSPGSLAISWPLSDNSLYDASGNSYIVQLHAIVTDDFHDRSLPGRANHALENEDRDKTPMQNGVHPHYMQKSSVLDKSSNGSGDTVNNSMNASVDGCHENAMAREQQSTMVFTTVYHGSQTHCTRAYFIYNFSYHAYNFC